jgi:hypothetical protein
MGQTQTLYLLKSKDLAYSYIFQLKDFLYLMTQCKQIPEQIKYGSNRLTRWIFICGITKPVCSYLSCCSQLSESFKWYYKY